MPLAMNINGPTVSRVLNKITIIPDESVLKFLQRLQDEQHFLTKFSAAPVQGLVGALNENGSKDGDMYEEVMRRQEFNWLPSSATNMKYTKLKGVKIVHWDDLGILWNCKLVDQTILEVKAHWDDAQLSRAEMEDLLGQLLDVAGAFAKKENWERTVAEVI